MKTFDIWAGESGATHLDPGCLRDYLNEVVHPEVERMQDMLDALFEAGSALNDRMTVQADWMSKTASFVDEIKLDRAVNSDSANN